MRFKLLRYFSITSGAAIIFITAVIGLFYDHNSQSHLVSTVERDNVILASALINTLTDRAPDFFAEPHTQDSLKRENSQKRIREIDDVLRTITGGLPILAVHIFKAGLTIYSSQSELIGSNKTSAGLEIAEEERKPASKLVFSGKFNAFHGEVSDRNIVETYVPIGVPKSTDEPWSRLVLEIYSDVSPVVAEISTARQRLLVSLVILFGLLYLALFAIVRHASRILDQQSAEIMRQEKRMAHQQKLESLGGLTSGIAHNLNNLLTPILTLSEIMLAKSPKASRDHSDLSVIKKAGEQAKTLVSNLKVFSRLEQKELQLINIHEIIRQSVELLGSTIPRSITIADDLDDDQLTVRADATQLQTVLLNIAANAVDAIGDQVGTLTFSTKRSQVDSFTAGQTGIAEGDYVEISISDTGDGMDPNTLRQVFDPFFTTKEVGQGTGLGLTTSYGIVRSQGGIITVVSELKKGSTFNVYIPLADGRPT
jgi:signal transduction histidine kinase